MHSAAVELRKPIHAVSTLRSTPSSTWVAAKKKYVKQMMRMYFAPSAMTCGLSVKIPRTAPGKKNAQRNSTAAMISATCMATAAAFLTFSMFFSPQNREASTITPSDTPPMSIWSRNWIWLTSATPDSASSV